MIKPFQGDFPITMHFGDPASWYKSGKHPGIDWACSNDTQLIASFDGTVIDAQPWNLIGYGRNITIQSNDGTYKALYAHCSVLGVKKGDKVKQGSMVAKSGHTGLCISTHGGDGAHLHFGLMKNGVWVDPLQYVQSPNQAKMQLAEHQQNPDPKQVAFITTGYLVQKGDSLWSIAKDFYGDGNLFHKISDANAILAPYQIKIGQVLKIPGFK